MPFFVSLLITSTAYRIFTQSPRKHWFFLFQIGKPYGLIPVQLMLICNK